MHAAPIAIHVVVARPTISVLVRHGSTLQRILTATSSVPTDESAVLWETKERQRMCQDVMWITNSLEPLACAGLHC
jgi:hypothetical protein